MTPRHPYESSTRAHVAERRQPAMPAAAPAKPERETPQMLTVGEVALELRVSKMTVYRLIHDQALAALRIGRSFRVPATALDDYLQVAEGLR